MKIKPLDKRVVIEMSQAEEKSVGGIILPDSAKEKPQTGKIVAVGSDADLQKLVKVGDEVLYSKYGGTEVKLEGKEFMILSQDDILAVVE